MTVRTRVTAVAGVALTAAVALGLVILYLVQVGSAHRTADDQLRTYATQIEQSARSGQADVWPRPLPAFPLDPNAQAQVLAADGASVLASTRALEGFAALYTLPAGAAAPIRQAAVDPALAGELRVVGTHAVVDGHAVTVVTWTSTNALGQINETFDRLLLVGVPGILLLACGTVWLVVGRALRPVERIRRSVTDISAADLSRRVPEPAARDEIGELARTMNGMLARLEDSAARQRRFVADASHELRTPLAAVRTALEVGLAHPDRAPWKQIAERAVRQSTRLETLVQDLLLLARSDDRHLVHHHGPVSIAALVQDVRAASPAPRVPVDFREAANTADDAGAGADARVLGDPEQLERMVRNIVDNAIRHARHRVELFVDDSAPDTVRIEIADDGPGIPAEERERVFDRFVRLDASRERGSGTSGLGLAIAKEIATAHGGTIAIGDAPSGGALVRITLPRAPE
jgi:signal transduction histidine kinase